MVEVSKKNNESFESLIRRFTRKTLQSGRLLQAKKIRFFRKNDSDFKRKESALRKESTRKQHEYLKRIGKAEEIQDRRPKRF